jgi:hypothetical protein
MEKVIWRERKRSCLSRLYTASQQEPGSGVVRGLMSCESK